MSSFDAELYLRLAGERVLLDPSARRQAQWGSPLTSAAQALVAVGSIAEQAAEAVLDDYGLAAALRDDEDGLAYRATSSQFQQRDSTAQPLAPRRVVPCGRDIEHPAGALHIHYVSLADDETSVAISFRPAVSVSARHGRGLAHRMLMLGGAIIGAWGPPQLTLADDRGTSVSTDFRGGGSDAEWHGRLHADHALARETAWIEIDGQRLALVDVEQPVDVAVQSLPEQAPALRHLWRLVTTPEHFQEPGEDVQPSIDALVAAGALSREDPAIDEIHAVLAAIEDAQMLSGRPAARHLPEPWRSLLGRQGRADGPTGTVVIGAVTPLFDAMSIAAMSLESTESGWAVEVEVAPDVMTRSPFEQQSARRRQLAWWATDDRGNHYLGQIADWSGSDGHGCGEISFWPALDPKAAHVDLLPTGDTQRAVIRVALRWHRAAEDAR